MLLRNKRSYPILLVVFALVLLVAGLHGQEAATLEFPAELTEFVPFSQNPVFTAGKPGDWDARIRERGWILREPNGYRLWYTGYDGTKEGLRMLGYATSPDGIHWTRHAENPLDRDHWIEDMMVVHQGPVYYMFAEGLHDRAQLLKSSDGVRWDLVGPLDVRLSIGDPIPEGPYGTPTVWFEKGKWYLFYERGDQGVWLATSTDMQVWTNVQDEPVLALGPDEYDREMIAMNQIISHNGLYYAYYHGSGDPPGVRRWATCLAVSDDLVHWAKYPENPLLPMELNKSSGIVVPSGNGLRLYTMHGQVDLFLSDNGSER